MADRCPVGPIETVVQQDRHVPYSLEPEQLEGLEDRILARATLYDTERNNAEPLVVEFRRASAMARNSHLCYYAPSA